MNDAPQTSREHGGNLAYAMATYGGDRTDWLDLSTGINPNAYPVPQVDPNAWMRLPETAEIDALTRAAARAYEVAPEALVVAAPGASALIAAMPRLASPGRVAIPEPTYNEHAAAFRAEGWEVTDRPGPGVAAAVIVNPNNPDGRRWSTDELLLMAEAVDLLIVDESFMDPTPELALCPFAGKEGLVILRSFGKFYGLAGLRLGFAVTGPETAARIGAMLGPWAVSGPAIDIGRAALTDRDWAEAMCERLCKEAARLRDVGLAAGWISVGGTALFQTFQTGDAARWQARLAAHRIWTRTFSYAPTWLRLGLPPEDGWGRLLRAMD